MYKIAESEAIIISFAEHNGSYSAAYKNLFDWCSRINPKVFQNKPVVMLVTSPGPGGAGRVLAATTSAPYFDADLKGSLSIPSFYDNSPFGSDSAYLPLCQMCLKGNAIPTHIFLELNTLISL